MADAYGIDGVMWILLLACAAFVVAFVGNKIGVLSPESGVVSFSKWASFIVAAVAALAMDTPSNKTVVIDVLGRASVFGLVWFVSSIFITLGAAMGEERAKK